MASARLTPAPDDGKPDPQPEPAPAAAPEPAPKRKHVATGQPGTRLKKSAGDREEYFRRCEEAAIRHASGSPYRQIAEQMGVQPSMAEKMVKNYLDQASRVFRAPEIRERLSMQCRNLQGRLWNELARIEADPTLDTPKRVTLRLAVFARMESIIGREATIYGFGNRVDVTIGAAVGSGAPTRLLPVPPREQRERLRALIRQVREEREQITGEKAQAIDAEFAPGNGGAPGESAA